MATDIDFHTKTKAEQVVLVEDWLVEMHKLSPERAKILAHYVVSSIPPDFAGFIQVRTVEGRSFLRIVTAGHPGRTTESQQ